jgi:hypothetical protein
MGLFHDTLHDARRPVSATWVRRSNEADTEGPVGPEEFSVPEEPSPSGMATVFRFQKAGPAASRPSASREASFRADAGRTRIPSGDPLSAAIPVEGPESSATNVNGDEDISARRVNRGSELETGQQEHAGPSKVTAANVNSETKVPRSAQSPESFESVSFRETHKPRIPDGRERTVSQTGEAFPASRPSGRGASPSDSFADPSAPHPGGEITAQRAVSGGTQPLPVASASASAGRGGLTPFGPSGVGSPASPNLPGTPSFTPPETPANPTGVAMPEAGPSSIPSRPAWGRSSQGGSADGAGPSTSWPARSPGRPAEPAPAGLVIGRIDVVVVSSAPALASAHPAPATPDRGFTSRNYLRRL